MFRLFQRFLKHVPFVWTRLATLSLFPVDVPRFVTHVPNPLQKIQVYNGAQTVKFLQPCASNYVSFFKFLFFDMKKRNLEKSNHHVTIRTKIQTKKMSLTSE